MNTSSDFKHNVDKLVVSLRRKVKTEKDADKRHRDKIKFEALKWLRDQL